MPPPRPDQQGRARPDHVDQSVPVVKADLQAIRELMVERDRRYEERFDGLRKQLEEAVRTEEEKRTDSNAASAGAISKAERAQEQYNQTHNDLARKMEEQYKMMLPRTEADNRFDAVNEAIAVQRERVGSLRQELMKEVGDLRESRSVNSGEKEGKGMQLNLIVALLGIFATVITIGGVVVAIALKIGK